MKGLSLTLAQLQKADNPAWRKIAGGAPDRKPRKKRFTGDASKKKAWVREQSAKPGRFFTTGRIYNWLNVKMHYHKAAEIHRGQHLIGLMEAKTMTRGKPPYRVTLTRYGPRILDTDGLAASLKYFRDGVAEALGIDDGDTARLVFVPWQEQAKWYGLRIEIHPLPHCTGCTDPHSEGTHQCQTQEHP